MPFQLFFWHLGILNFDMPLVSHTTAAGGARQQGLQVVASNRCGRPQCQNRAALKGSVGSASRRKGHRECDGGFRADQMPMEQHVVLAHVAGGKLDAGSECGVACLQIEVNETIWRSCMPTWNLDGQPLPRNCAAKILSLQMHASPKEALCYRDARRFLQASVNTV